MNMDDSGKPLKTDPQAAAPERSSTDDAGEELLITPDEIKTALEASGYLLEGRVGRALESKGFYVELSSFRADPRDENKSIEIDVWGRFAETINKENGSYVVAEPLIECKNNSQPVIFFLKRQPVQEINDNNIKYAGWPVSSADPETKHHVSLHKLLVMKDWHHYCLAPEVATQFCSFTRNSVAEELVKKQRQKEKKGSDVLLREDWRWKTEAMENYSKSFSSLCVAVATPGAGGFDIRKQNIELEFYYPIVVFQGPLYEARIKGGEVELRRADHLQFHHAASMGSAIVRVQIDVVSEQGFPGLVETIKDELRRIAEAIRGMEERLLKSAIDQKQVASQRFPIAPRS